MSLLSILAQSMTSQSSVESVSKKTGISSSAVQMLIAAAIPMLIKSMTKNASSKDGASSLLGALTQHTSTKSLTDQIAEADEADGTKIIGHIFGNDTANVVNQLASQTGLDSGQVNSVLGNVAPALLSSLSAVTADSQQAQAASASSGGGIGSLLGGLLGGGSSGAASSAASATSALSSILGNSSGDLTSLLGGASNASSGGGIGGLLSGLLGGGSGSTSSGADDGSDLLSSLLGGMF